MLEERSFIPILTNLVTDDQPLEITLRSISESYLDYMKKNLHIYTVAMENAIGFPECAKQIYQEIVLKGNLILSKYLEKQAKLGYIYPLENSFLASRAFIGMLLSHVITQEIFGGKK